MKQRYKLKYILSDGRILIHDGNRNKISKEWEQNLISSNEEIVKSLKLGRGKYKTIKVVEMSFIDWANNLIVNKIFESEVVINN